MRLLAAWKSDGLEKSFKKPSFDTLVYGRPLSWKDLSVLFRYKEVIVTLIGYSSQHTNSIISCLLDQLNKFTPEADKKKEKKSPVLTHSFMDDPFHEKMSFAAAMLKVQHMPLLSSFK